MRNRMREMGVKECFNLLPNPRLPFPCFISPKKQKKKNQFLSPHAPGLKERFFFPLGASGASRERALPPQGALPRRSLKNQGAHLFERNRAP
jgi:hypothetical protein